MILEEFEDIKGVIRIRKSKTDRQHNGKKKKDKRTNNDLEHTQSTKHTHKTKDWVTRTPLQTGDGLGCPGRVGSSCSNSPCPHHIAVNPNSYYTHFLKLTEHCQVEQREEKLSDDIFEATLQL